MIPHPDSPVVRALSQYKINRYQEQAATARLARRALGPSLIERKVLLAALNSIEAVAGLLTNWYEEIKYKLTH